MSTGGVAHATQTPPVGIPCNAIRLGYYGQAGAATSDAPLIPPIARLDVERLSVVKVCSRRLDYGRTHFEVRSATPRLPGLVAGVQPE